MVLTSNISDSEVKWEKLIDSLYYTVCQSSNHPRNHFIITLSIFTVGFLRKKLYERVAKISTILSALLPCGIWMLKTVIELVLIIKSEVD